MPTHYEVLGVTSRATPQDVKAAYRAKVREVHPDVAGPSSRERFDAVRQAYETLSDPARRASYDRILELDAELARRKEESQRVERAAAEVERDVGLLVGLMNRGRLVEAERMARNVLERDHRQPVPYAVLADLAATRGDLDTAAKYYAFAAQYDSRNPIYQRKHEEMLNALQSRLVQQSVVQDGRKVRAAAWVGAGLLLAMAAYVALNREAPFAPWLPPVSSWTLGLVGMLAAGGVTIGATLAAAGMLDRQDARGGAQQRLTPGAALGALSVLNFWLAAGVYVGFGLSQGAFNASLSRVVASVAGLVLLFTCAAGLGGAIGPMQVLVWGGNLAYLFALLGWAVSDALRKPA